MNNDMFSKKKRSWVMSRIKNKDTTPEIILRKTLWNKGLRYRKNLKTLPGKPDIVFTKYRTVVFVDGAFWHGKKLSKERLKKMSPYWQEKIHKNVARDKKNTRLLKELGFKVLRITDIQIAKNLDDVVNRITLTLSVK